MVDFHTVCCMCGDIGFPDKLFRCTNCHHRFQHSYCSNYCDESSSTGPGHGGFCDWCLCELRSPSSAAKHGVVLSSRRSSGREALALMNRTTSDKDHQLENNEKVKSSTSSSASTTTTTTTGTPSPRPSNRRYKFLKDVMC